MRTWTRCAVGLALGAGLLLAGAGPAAADEGPDTPRSASAVCTERIPAVLARIDRVTARINGDAGTVGSTRWLQKRAERARAGGFTALADLLDERVAGRPDRLTTLGELRKDVENVLATDCAG